MILKYLFINKKLVDQFKIAAKVQKKFHTAKFFGKKIAYVRKKQ